ncbi:hypothetical protein BIS47_04 [Klebsiella phage vB_KpnM_BIS47]|uniref:Uncharacterized protein n=1 Tax=Klebsiella phage vB_KpnM_BIS47 TaxID=1907784 RepID=A0A1V0E6L1_9CAUD|nr:hypothetical protein BIS47_04 [Klebsiella phage vB_KpnM_BIS47]ARB12508.1 hypothetical protein BIS47_04 [Klebsiella phage vB_KpnM_BIS47]
MDQTKLEILHFLEKSLEEKQGWTYHKEVADKFGEPATTEALASLIGNGKVMDCGCGCSGMMITPAGLEDIRPPKRIMVWKTESGKVVRLTHMSDDHLRNAIIWLLTDSSLTDEHEGYGITQWLVAMSRELHSRVTV